MAMALLCTAAAPAAVVYSEAQSLDIPLDFEGIYLDFNDPLDPLDFDVAYVEPANWDLNAFFGGAAVATSDTLLPVLEFSAVNSELLNLPAETTVDGSLNYPTSFSGSLGHMDSQGGQFFSGVEGYVGFTMKPAAFTANVPSGDLFGWMKVTLNEDGTTGKILAWAWETTGMSIETAQIPEPGFALLLAASFFGVLLFRKVRTRNVD